MEQNNMDSRNEQWRIDLRNSKTPKERTAIPRVEMPQLDPKYRITCNEEVTIYPWIWGENMSLITGRLIKSN